MAALCLVPISGCASLGVGSAGGPTLFKQTFVDTEPGTVDPATGTVVPGHNTEYKLDIKARPGTELAQITKMSYTWDQATGNIIVNGDAKLDTTLQAQMVTTIATATAAAVSQAWKDLLNTAGPLAGQWLSRPPEAAPPGVGSMVGQMLQNPDFQAFMQRMAEQMLKTKPAPNPTP